MFLLNVLLHLTDELDVLCLSFEFFIADLLKNAFDSKYVVFNMLVIATQNTSASLYSILT